MLACEMIARYLRDAGVTKQFGVLGEGNIAIATALRELGVPFVAARREDGAVAMADGWARRTGDVGFASVTQGPGMTNTVTSLTEASRHGTPLVLLTGVTPAKALHNPQRFPTEQLVGLTGAGWRRLRDVTTIADDVRAVFANALTEGRPYVLGIDTEILYEVVDTQLLNNELPEVLALDWRMRKPPAISPDAEGIEASAELIAAARRPVILVGRGACGGDRIQQIERLAEHLGAPIATTLLGKGLAAQSKRHIGICGGFATAHGADLVSASDLILAFGCSLNPWTATELIADSRIVHVDVDPSALGRWVVPDVGVIGDAGLTARAILAALEGRARMTSESDVHVRNFDPQNEVRDDMRRGVEVRAPFHVGEVALAMREAFPTGAVLCADTGQATADIVSYVEVSGPSRFVYPIHAGSIGLGLGAAIGAASATHGEWVIHFTGDGSLMMSLQELATVVEIQPRLAIVVLDDNGYGAEVLYTRGRGLPSNLATVPHPDFKAVAEAFGLDYRKVEVPDDLESIRSLVENGGGPTLFHVPIEQGSSSRFFRDYSTVQKIESWSGGQ